MNKTIRRGLNWCKRFRNRCGYGVHSPYDFYLITFVIYEKLPYYAYSYLHHLRRLVSHLPGHREKVDKLLFRLVNHLQPKIIFEYGTGSGMSTRYMSEVSRNIQIYTCLDTDVADTQVSRILSTKSNIELFNRRLPMSSLLKSVDSETPYLVHIAHTQEYKSVYEEILPYIQKNEKACIIVSYPYLNKEKTEWWKQIIADPRSGVTFDLYDIGIIFFDKKRVKENRIVNFL